MAPYVPVYRKLLARAIKAAWQHRLLWLFGFFAGVVQTGAITNDVLRLAPKLAPGAFSWSTLHASWSGFTYGQTFFSALVTGTPAQIVGTLLLTFGYVLFCVILVLIAQHLVLTQVHRSANKKKHRGLKIIASDIRGVHLSRLFAVNALSRLALFIVLLLGALLLRTILTLVPPAANLYASLGVYLLVLPFAFLVNAVGMMTLIHLVRANDGVLASLQKAATLLHRHWLSAVEFSAILFLISFVLTLLMLAGLYLVAAIALALLAAAVGSAMFTLVALAISGLMTLFFVLCLGGMMTTFNYAAWTEFLERYERLPAHPRSEHAVRHLTRAFSR